MTPPTLFRALSRALLRAKLPTAAQWIRSFVHLTRCPPRDMRAILENLTAGEREALPPRWQTVIAARIERGMPS